MKRYIVVTGGAGFVGSNLIKYLLLKTKNNIISLDNYSTGSKKNHVKNIRVKYINADTNNITIILRKFKKNIAVIFHFGEFARIHQSFVRTGIVSILIFPELQVFFILVLQIKLKLFIQQRLQVLEIKEMIKACHPMPLPNLKIYNY